MNLPSGCHLHVGVFLEGVGPDTYLRQSLEPFARGVAAAGDKVTLVTDLEYEPCDVAVIFGDVRGGVLKEERMKFKAEVKGRHIHRGLVVVDTPILTRATRVGGQYRRIGIDGLLRGEADFRNCGRTAHRWRAIAADADLEIKPWRRDGNRIVLALQRPTDASIPVPEVRRSAYYRDWLLRTIDILLSVSPRPIYVRPHPASLKMDSEAKWIEVLRKDIGSRAHWDLRPISFIECLADCWTCISYSSGSAVEAVIAGVPSIVGNSGSFAWDVSGHDVSKVEEPFTPERTSWLNDLAWVEWSLPEIEQGSPWLHLRPAFTYV